MTRAEQRKWLKTHVPHRLRAATARLDMSTSLLGETAYINPFLATDVDRIYWRCATDAIWEGRLAATRWLIEFVGIKSNEDGDQIEYTKSKNAKRSVYDVRIDDLGGGRIFSVSMKGAKSLAKVWKGCSQASSHATRAYKHFSVREKTLQMVLRIILRHLQSTVYDHARLNVRDFVLGLPEY